MEREKFRFEMGLCGVFQGETKWIQPNQVYLVGVIEGKLIALFVSNTGLLTFYEVEEKAE